MKISLFLISSLTFLLTSIVLADDYSTTSHIDIDAEPSPSKWSKSFSSSISRNLDEFSDYYARYKLGLSYELNDKYNLSSALSYKQTLDEINENEDIYGFSDIYSQLAWKNQIDIYQLKSSSYISITLPTSQVSRNSGLILSTSYGLGFKKSFGRLALGTEHEFNYNLYRFETANKSGTEFNSPFGISNSLYSIYTYGSLSWNNSVGFYNYKKYDDEFYQINIVATSLSYSFSPYTLGLGYSWKDRRETNLSFFDDDTTQWNLSFKVIF